MPITKVNTVPAIDHFVHCAAKLYVIPAKMTRKNPKKDAPVDPLDQDKSENTTISNMDADSIRDDSSGASGGTQTLKVCGPGVPGFSNLSEEGSTLASLIQKTIDKIGSLETSFSTQLSSINTQLQDKIDFLVGKMKTLENQVKMLESNMESLKVKTDSLEKELKTLKSENRELKSELHVLSESNDSLESYTRRECIIISGKSVPPETDDENTDEIVIKLVKEKLNKTLSNADIHVSHRIGSTAGKPDGYVRPIIIKLFRRPLKYELMSACLREPRPANFYINESLTAKRLKLLQTIRSLLADHRDLFKQCYTRNGKIIVQLVTQHKQKHSIHNTSTLLKFLNTCPTLKSAYDAQKSD